MIQASSITNIPRPEYPRPQFERADWINLNGQWTFTFDPGKSGMQRGLAASSGFEHEITVPFCPESELSGVNHKDFIEMMWYHRKLAVPASWTGQRVILHFGAVDYESEIFIDGQSVGRHYGGTVSFSYDISQWVKPGQAHDLVVYVRDDLRAGNQPGGKQCPDFTSRGCHYTRTTGIWQTVWMEAAPMFGLKSVFIVPDLDGSRFIITPTFYAMRRGLALRVILRDDTREVSLATAAAVDGVPVIAPVSHPKLWSPDSPFLYDLDLAVLDETGAVVDQVKSYAGMRKVHVEDGKVFINNQPLFLRLVLD